MRDRSSGAPSRGADNVSGFTPDAFLARDFFAAGASAFAGSYEAAGARLIAGRGPFGRIVRQQIGQPTTRGLALRGPHDLDAAEIGEALAQTVEA